MDIVPTRKRVEGAVESEEISHPVDLFDRTNPRSVINILPPETQAIVFETARKRADLFRMDERALKKEAKPTITDNRLRLAFWTEYNRAQDMGTDMKISAVYSGICTRQNFNDRYLTSPENVAWMLLPPTSYVVIMEEMLVHGRDRLREIMEENPIKDGEVDFKLAELQFKIHVYNETRYKGAVVQRVQTHSLVESTNKNYNVNADAGAADVRAVHKIDQIESMADIDEKLARLRKQQASRERTMMGPPPVVEGEIVVGEGKREPAPG